MKVDPSSPPSGTVRDWLDCHATDRGADISHVFTDGGAPLTWAKLRDEAREISGRLRGLGIETGESVALMLPNGRDAVVCLMGVLYGGFRVTPINLVAGNDAISYAIEHSGARIVFVGPDQKSLCDEVVPKQKGPAPLHINGSIDWPGSVDAPLEDIGAEDDALLMYTSGTTGRPKGVVHSHASLLAGGWTPALAHQLTPEDRALCILPIYHINGLCVTVFGPFVSGGSVAMCNRFSVSRFWQQCLEAEVTWFSAVPTILSHILHGDEDPDPAVVSRIRFARSASSALAPDVQRAFEARFGVPIVETMGLTETSAQILSNPLPPGVRKIGSPGIAFGNEVAILSEAQQPLPSDVEGEIAVRGPNVMRGYLRNPEANAAAFAGRGWLRTGDLGRIDDDGYVFVTGRLKELIIKGGENIAPREIDEALYAHGDVVEAAAFARPCDVYGERVEAAVRLCDGSTLAAEDLIGICRDRLGSFKCPDAVHILDSLPKGPSGKIQRLKLVELTALPAV